MVVIRLVRNSCSKDLTYSVVVQDSRSPRDGRFIEKVGHFDTRIENGIKLKYDRIEYWVRNGAKPSDRVKKLMRN